MTFSEEISARQTAVKVAAAAMQATIEKYGEIQDVEQVTQKIVELADTVILPYILQGSESQPRRAEDITFHVEARQKKKGPDIAQYSEAFKKYDFVKSKFEDGGYWANLTASKLAELFAEYPQISHDIIFRVQESRR